MLGDEEFNVAPARLVAGRGDGGRYRWGPAGLPPPRFGRGRVPRFVINCGEAAYAVASAAFFSFL